MRIEIKNVSEVNLYYLDFLSYLRAMYLESARGEFKKATEYEKLCREAYSMYKKTRQDEKLRH